MASIVPSFRDHHFVCGKPIVSARGAETVDVGVFVVIQVVNVAREVVAVSGLGVVVQCLESVLGTLVE